MEITWDAFNYYKKNNNFMAQLWHKMIQNIVGEMFLFMLG